MIRPPFERVEVIVPARGELAVGAELADAIVVVEEGEVELVGRHGGTLHVGRGAVLWLKGVTLRNHGPNEAVLSAVRR